MRKYEGVTLSTIDDIATRQAFERIDKFLRQLSIAVGGSPQQSADVPGVMQGYKENEIFELTDLGTAIAGVEAVPGKVHIARVNSAGALQVTGTITATIPTVDEDDAITTDTQGQLIFGRDAASAVARALRVDANGELLVAELPGVTLAAAFANSQAMPAFISMIGTLSYVKRSSSGPEPANMGRLTGVDIGGSESFDAGFIVGEGSVASDVGLAVVPSPKVMARSFAEFNQTYTVSETQNMTSGTHATGARMGMWRFTRAALSFTAGVNGTPPTTLTITIQGSPVASGPNVSVKHFVFDATSFTDNDSDKYLQFDVTHPYMTITIAASTGGAGGNYAIANFYLIGFSQAA